MNLWVLKQELLKVSYNMNNNLEPKCFSNLKNIFKLLPGVGEKTAERYVFSLLNINESKIQEFSKELLNLKENLSYCEVCGCLIETNKCTVCENNYENNDIICVVENFKNVLIFNKTNTFNGKYHVLGGLISPIDGINPENINIANLISRVKKENVKEVILALRPGIEGETTSLYIKKVLEKENVKVSKIAQGIPIGTDLEYIDELTLQLALNNRKDIS